MAKPRSAPKICFFVAPIGKAGTIPRQRSDFVFKMLKEALGSKYSPIRSDQIPTPGSIVQEMIRLLLDAPLVVADLHGANPNVYYELAVRHAVGKPVIQLIGKGEEIPFDIADMRTFEIDVLDYPGSRDRIAAAVKAVENSVYRADTQISLALDRRATLSTSPGEGRPPN